MIPDRFLLLLSSFKSIFRSVSLSLFIAAFFFAGGAVYGETVFVEVKKPFIPIRDNASVTANIIYTSSQGVIFATIGKQGLFYETNLLDGGKGWLHQDDVVLYNGNPPIERIGILYKTDGSDILPDGQSVSSAYLLPDSDNFRYPVKQDTRYPDLQIDGFYEGKLSGRNYDPKSISDPRFEVIRRDPIYNKLPRDVLLGDPKFDIRYRFNIDGKLNEKLSVHYDVEQEPDFPGKYDIRVKYDRSELTFYHFNSEFNNGEFIGFNKALDGVKATTETDNWSFQFSVGRERSEPKKFETLGNGQRKYNLGNRSILEGSVQVYVNNNLMREGVHYKVNYYEGEIEFLDGPKQPNDFIKVIYEFTNPIEDFIPALTRKNFLGTEFHWRADTTPEIKKLTNTHSETLWPAQKQGEVPSKEYDLAHTYVVLGSDVVRLNGKPLKPINQYVLKHNKGKLILNNIALTPSDVLTISYSYYLTESVTEKIVARDTTGPYELRRTALLPETSVVFIDNQRMNEFRDYTIDYEAGKLYFNFKVDFPKVITITYESIKTVVVAKDVAESPYTVGVSYMNQSVKAREEELVLQSPTQNFTTTSNIFFVNPQYTPLAATASIIIKVNGSQIPSSDYEILDNYKGEIELTNVTPGSTNTVAVQNSYRRSFRTFFTFQGIDGKNDAFYVNGTTDFELLDIPMRFDGLAYISIWNGVEELRISSSSYEIDYGTNGEDIKIRFIKNDGINFSDLEEYPGSSTRITLAYDYAPESSPDEGDISQTMVGLTASAKVTDFMTVRSELVGAQNNFSKPREVDKAEFSGNGKDNFSYFLGNRNLVEDSEIVFINGILQTKNRDYTINYTNGTIKFRVTPGTVDQITVDYEFFKSGVAEVGEQTPFKFAKKLSSDIELGDINAHVYVKDIDKDFVPISPIKERDGTTAFGGRFNWLIGEESDVDISYDRRNESRESADSDQGNFFHQDDFKARTKVKIFEHLVTNQEVRYLADVLEPNDASTTTNPHTIDQTTFTYEGDVVIGPADFQHILKRSFSSKVNDAIDRNDLTLSTIEKNSYYMTWSLRELFMVRALSINPYVEQLQSNTVQQDVPVAFDNRFNYGLNSEIRPFDELSARFNYNMSSIESKTSTTTSENISNIVNLLYNVDYKPFSWFFTDFTYQIQENESPLINQKGTITTKTDFNIRKFSPEGLLTSIGFAPDGFLVSPLRRAYLTYYQNNIETRENNNRKSLTRDLQRISFNTFEPIDGIKLQKLFYETEESININLLETATTSSNISSREYSRWDGNLSVRLRWPILNMFSYTHDFEIHNETRINTIDSFVTTRNITIEDRPYFKRIQKVSFDPGQFVIPLDGKSFFNLGKFGTSLSEFWEDRVSSKNVIQISTAGVTTNTLTQDNSYVKRYVWETAYSPLNLFDLKSKITSANETYSRANIASLTSGTTIRDIKQFDIDAYYKPFDFLSFSASYDNDQLSQFRSPTVNMSRSDIKAAQDQEDFSRFTDFIMNHSDTIYGETLITPFRFISLKGAASLRDIKQNVISSFNIDGKFDSFSQQVGTAGLIIRPLDNLSIGYDYSLKRTFQNSEYRGIGFGGQTSITYTPFSTPFFDVRFSYTRTDTWGKDLNDLDRNLSLQGSDNTIETQIKDRRDTVELGSLTINIKIPLPNSPFVENLVISGEGHLKKVSDDLDRFKGATETKNSYEIAGMVIKGTLNF